MAINEQLKFTWGHIMAFMAIIFISYISFLGISYLTNGEFIYAGIGVFLIDLLLMLYFILPQLLKGTERKFETRIAFERILVFTAPIAFMVLIIPSTHFWTVHEKRDQVRTAFEQSVQSTEDMFVSYEKYAEARLNKYNRKLKNAGVASLMRNEKVNALKIQLLSENFTNLQAAATEWLEEAASATVWNVFMLGNIDRVEESLTNWNRTLTHFSENIMQDEGNNVQVFSDKNSSASEAKNSIRTLTGIYTKPGFPTILSIVLSIVLYWLLMTPYLIQARNMKNKYRLFGTKKLASDVTVITINNGDEKETIVDKPNTDNTDNYQSFTI